MFHISCVHIKYFSMSSQILYKRGLSPGYERIPNNDMCCFFIALLNSTRFVCLMQEKYAKNTKLYNEFIKELCYNIERK